MTKLLLNYVCAFLNLALISRGNKCIHKMKAVLKSSHSQQLQYRQKSLPEPDTLVDCPVISNDNVRDFLLQKYNLWNTKK